MPLSQTDRAFLRQIYRNLADKPLPPGSEFYEPVYQELGLDDPVQQISTLIDFDGVRALRDQGRASEAEAVFRETLELVKEAGNAEGLRIISSALARAVREQGRAAEADAVLRDIEGSAESQVPAASGAIELKHV
jgi:hypothetical protein